MFRRSSSESLTLELHGESYSFRTPQELEFALAGRTCLPASKISSLVELEDDALLREAEAIRVVEQRFVDALSGSLEDVTSIGSFLDTVDISLISQDHDWRGVIMALSGLGRSFDIYKKVALVKYMQYLTSRQEVIKTLYSSRQMNRLRGAEAPEPASNGEGKMRETLIFDVTAFAGAQGKDVEFSRIPKGETVEIVFEPNQHVDVLIAKHRCGIEMRDGLVFLDDQGRDSVLRPGKVIVGRDSSSDIVINPNFRDVSRKHLIVETDGANTVRLTDISSHGTSVPHEFLESTSI